MKQIVILSGKGGTGKTSVAAAFAHLASQTLPALPVLVDADVDASNLELLLAPRVLETHDFIGGQIATVDATLCTGCRTCTEVCRFGAIVEEDNRSAVDPLACEGCGVCTTQCPSGAIHMEPHMSGRWFRSETRYGPLFHAALYPAQENSGKLVALIKQQALQLARNDDHPLMLVDGPPGVGCPVIATAAGADLAVIVAEPTTAGIHDMKRILKTTQHFRLPSLVCVNKYDISPQGFDEIITYCCDHNLTVIGRLPFDTTVIEAMVHGQPPTLYRTDGYIRRAFQETWEQVILAVDEGIG